MSAIFELFEEARPVVKGRNNVLPRSSSIAMFGLLVCYAAVNQVRFGSTPEKGLDNLDDVADDLDSVCSLDSKSKGCVEHEMFSSWHAALSDDGLDNLEAVLLNEGIDVADPSPAPPKQPTSEAKTPLLRQRQQASTPAPHVEMPAAEEASEEDQSPLAKQIEKARCEMCLEPRHRDYPACSKFRSVTTCEVEESVLDQIDHARCEMCMEPQHREYPDCAKFRSVSSCEEFLHAEHESHHHASTWATELAALKARRPRHIRHVHHVPRASATSSDKKEEPMVDQIDNLGCEMCLDPSRRDNPTCVHFLHTPACMKHHKQEATYTTHMHELSEEHHAWESKVEDTVAAFRRQLCADPTRKSYHACADLASTAAEPARSLRGGKTPAAPTAAPTQKSRSSLRGSSAAAAAVATVVNRLDLKDHSSLLVRGSVPTVAAVVVLREGYGAVAKLPHVVKGFLNQTYEGPSMLMLVYHYQNAEAAKAVRPFADGRRIHAVAVRGDSHEIVSPASFRFGAWRAEKEGADLIVRWDLEAYHGRERLEMQVRALAFSERAACVLHQPGSPLSTAAADGMEWGERTLMGEAKWMRQFWYPVLDQTESLLEGPEKSHLAILDMPELFVYVGHHHHAPAPTSSTLSPTAALAQAGGETHAAEEVTAASTRRGVRR